MPWSLFGPLLSEMALKSKIIPEALAYSWSQQSCDEMKCISFYQ
jgi:hypothetical protein